jgi:hypothetical protein
MNFARYRHLVKPCAKIHCSECKSTVKPGGLQQSRLSSLYVKRLNERVRNLKAEMQPKSSANLVLTSSRLLGRRIDYGNDWEQLNVCAILDRCGTIANFQLDRGFGFQPNVFYAWKK